MYDVLNCIAFEHDLRLVLLAATLCGLSSCVALILLSRAVATTGSAKGIWLATGGAAGGFGIWATHFVAMLAYDPGIVVGYEVLPTLVSLLVAVLATTLACSSVAYRSGSWTSLAAGAILGCGVSAMHFMGMTAIEFPGHIEWKPALVIAAVVLCVVFSTGAFHIYNFNLNKLRATLAGTGVLTLAIVSMHFTAMGAISVVADPSAPTEGSVVSPSVMVATIASVAFSMLFAGLTAAIFAVRGEAAAAAGEEKFRLLGQGVSDYALYMLDPEGRVTNWFFNDTAPTGIYTLHVVGSVRCV